MERQTSRHGGARPTIRKRMRAAEHEAAHGRSGRVVRWIGAGARRDREAAVDESRPQPPANVIRLNWAQTYGRRTSLPATDAERVGIVLAMPSRSRGIVSER